MDYPKIIQGGMGVAVSSWQLANTVSRQGALGVVSGTGIGLVLASRLLDGDLEGHTRRALSHFPFQEPVQKILDKYYVPGGIKNSKYKRPPMWTLKPDNALTIIGDFVEVFLAKEGHDNPVGINLLEKVQMPNLASLYGAMLAGVDCVIIGAGIPIQIPGILDKLAHHEPVNYRVDVLGADPDDDYRIHFDPEKDFPGITEKMGALKRPLFFPIISSIVLAKALLKRTTGEINGFVVEMPSAGGHNAPPRGKMELNDIGEPVYGVKDEIDLERLKEIGLPFWLAGGYGKPGGLQEALDAGAEGIQVGTLFAYSNESGMSPKIKKAVIDKVLKGEAKVYTDPVASPTGFPFKVVEIETTMSEQEVYTERPRICDIGYLRHLYKREDGKVGYRCPAEPVEDYVRKGGDVEDTVGRKCLCNGLGGAAGFRQLQKTGYLEPAVVTAGDALPDIINIIKEGETSYSAIDVLAYLTEKVPV